MTKEKEPNLTKTWTEADIFVDQDPGVSVAVTLNARKAVVGALNELGFGGEGPYLVLSGELLFSKKRVVQSARYDPEVDPREITIYEKGLNFLFAQPDLPAQVKVLLVAAHMAVFYVQFHQAQGESDWHPTEEQTREAKRVSVSVANRILNYPQFAFQD